MKKSLRIKMFQFNFFIMYIYVVLCLILDLFCFYCSDMIRVLKLVTPLTPTPRYSPWSKLFHCRQGTCDYSSKVKSNVTRHQKSTCLSESREEWTLRQRTCQQCGHVLMQAKFIKKHQLTKYCVKQRDIKLKEKR